MLRSPHPDIRERILGMGSLGTGKTTSWLQIALWLQNTGSPGRVYAIDTDRSVKHMLATIPEYAALQNIEVAEVFHWTEYVDALDRFRAIAGPQDWIVADFVGSSWEAVQSWYVDKIYGESVDNFFVQARQGGDNLDGWKDWSVINKVYKKWMNDLIHRTDCQIFLTAVAEAIRDTDDRALKATFGPHGVRPIGQKHLGHQVHTVLLYRSLMPGEIYLSTIKDRGRTPIEGSKLNDFVADYLIGVAGWQFA